MTGQAQDRPAGGDLTTGGRHRYTMEVAARSCRFDGRSDQAGSRAGEAVMIGHRRWLAILAAAAAPGLGAPAAARAAAAATGLAAPAAAPAATAQLGHDRGDLTLRVPRAAGAPGYAIA